MASQQSSSGPPLPTATLLGGVSLPLPSSGTHSVSATLSGVGELAATLGALDIDGTLDQAHSGAPAVGAGGTATAAGRTTVLPRRKPESGGEPPLLEERPRFAHVRALGQGAMGQVDLARDNDIRRTVAVKRLLPTEGASESALLRFADEVRVVGQLEHPGIVPVYDVGRNEQGEVYLVMKHLHGETMEDILTKLRSGDAAYLERFSPEYRVHVFLTVLDAMRYAHARGILHRDLKPANIMIGPFGEVTVMDWGIAKPIRRGAGGQASEALQGTLLESHDQRLLETQFGSLAGTPLYMSPEQAAGRNDQLDERSDVYALCVVLFEWLVLEHPLQGKATITEVLAAIISEDYQTPELLQRVGMANIAAEYAWLLQRGLQRDRERRYQSVSELEDAIKRVLDGRVRVQCHITFGKRVASEIVHFIDRHMVLYSIAFFVMLLGALGGLGYLVWSLI